MSLLNQQKCEACRADSLPVTSEETAEFSKKIPGWNLVEADGEKRLQKAFKFKNFAEALAFTNRVGSLAEEQNHHPALLTEWGVVTVTWWTHKIHGLHRNDFIMAARTDLLV